MKPSLAILFTSPNCSACRAVKPVAEEKVGDRLFIVDVSENLSAAVEYGVRSVPTLILFNATCMQTRATGIHDIQELLK